MSNNIHIVERNEAIWRLAVAQRSKDLKIEELSGDLRDALRRTLHRIRQLEEDCRIHYRGNAIMQYKLSRIQLMAARLHLLNLIKKAKGEPVEEEVSPWSHELGLSKIPPKMRHAWQENSVKENTQEQSMSKQEIESLLERGWNIIRGSIASEYVVLLQRKDAINGKIYTKRIKILGPIEKAARIKTYKELKDNLPKTMTVMRTPDNECRVNYRGGPESTAYYTDDLSDAFGTAMQMHDELKKSKIIRKRFPKAAQYLSKSARLGRDPSSENAQARPFANIVDENGNHKAKIYFDSRSNSYYTPLIARTRAGRNLRGFRGERSPLTLLNSIKRHHKQHGKPVGADKWQLAKAKMETSAFEEKSATEYSDWELPGLCRNVDVIIKDLPHWTRQELAEEYKAANGYTPKNETQSNFLSKLKQALIQALGSKTIYTPRSRPVLKPSFNSLQRFNLAQNKDKGDAKSAAIVSDLPFTMFPNKVAAEQTLQKMHKLDPHDNWSYKVVEREDGKSVIQVYDPEGKLMGNL